MAEAWEPSKKQYSFRNRGALDRKALFTFFSSYFECWSLYGNIQHQYDQERGLVFKLTAEDKLVIYVSITAKNKVCNVPH